MAQILKDHKPLVGSSNPENGEAAQKKLFDKTQTLKAKGIAILLLLFHHLFYSQTRIEANGVVFQLLKQETVMLWATLARVCVHIFVFLSAYGLSKQYEKIADTATMQDRVSFVKKRWLSLMKPYWIIFGIMCVVFVIDGTNPLEVFHDSWLALVLCFFGVSDFFGTAMPVAAWWYMCLAQILVVALPFLYDLCKRYGIMVLIMSFLLVPYIGTGIQSNFGGAYINYLFVAVMGVVFAQTGFLDRTGEKSGNILVQVVEACVLLLAAVGCAFINYRYAAADEWKVTKLFVSAAAVMICVFSYRYIGWKWVARPLAFLGKHSGTIFLVHAFTYTFWPKTIYWSGNPVLVYLSILAISLLFSIALEQVMKLTRRLQIRKKA